MKNKKFCKMLRDALKDEKKAAPFYKRLEGRVSDPGTKVMINSIANDEKRHHGMLKNIENMFCKS